MRSGLKGFNFVFLRGGESGIGADVLRGDSGMSSSSRNVVNIVFVLSSDGVLEGLRP